MSDPVLNMVYITIDDHIGYNAVGRIPIRNDPLNYLPLDGTK